MPRRLGIPGEDLAGSHTATEFVGWYNGHPDYRDRVFVDPDAVVPLDEPAEPVADGETAPEAETPTG